MKRFDKKYWELNYSEPKTMDGIGNAKDHAAYLKALFNLEDIKINSIIDLGFGTGDLFATMIKTFKPKIAVGIEPSEFIFKKALLKKSLSKAKLFNIGLLEWSEKKENKTYDLALCTSVLQYLSDGELKKILPVMSGKIKYLYLTVPTDHEYLRQKREHNFSDDYAIVRTRSEYLKLLSPYFRIVSSRVLESKIHFTEDTSIFSEHLFRF